MSRIEGHKKGAEAVRRVVREARRLGIPILTLFVFSLQNWKRPKEEVDELMNLLEEFIVKERDEILKNGIRLVPIGDLKRLPQSIQIALDLLVKESAKNKDMDLGLCLSYGGQEEILEGIKNALSLILKGKLNLSTLTREEFSKLIPSSVLGEVDLLIRTGGELRISNFLLWQMAYTELYFTDVLWPEFTEDEFIKAIRAYQKRERRFGRIPE
jgi:undecaprenyl diphosphate synthase